MGALGRGRGSVGGCSSYVKFLAHVQQPHKRGYRKYKKKKITQKKYHPNWMRNVKGGGWGGAQKIGRQTRKNQRAALRKGSTSSEILSECWKTTALRDSQKWWEWGERGHNYPKQMDKIDPTPSSIWFWLGFSVFR